MYYFQLNGLFSETLFLNLQKKVIVIDPGHGGEDPGSIGFSGKYEKDINLEISIMLKEKLNLNGYKAILTRDSDKYTDNILRAEMANKEND